MQICEKVGLDLAEILIENGAEDIMEAARQEIVSMAKLVSSYIHK